MQICELQLYARHDDKRNRTANKKNGLQMNGTIIFIPKEIEWHELLLRKVKNAR